MPGPLDYGLELGNLARSHRRHGAPAGDSGPAAQNAAGPLEALERADVLRLVAFLTARHVELDSLSLVERLEAVARDV